MRIITTAVLYSKRSEPLAIEMAKELGLTITEKDDIVTVGYDTVVISDEEYWKYWSILDAPISVREIS